MTSGWRLLGIAAPPAIVAVMLCTGSSCGFPEPPIEDDATSNNNDAGQPTGDVVVSEGSKPNIGPCADPCDCDEDNATKRTCVEAGADATIDCDDDDPRATPGTSFKEDSPVAPTNGDWDCSGQAEPQYPVGVGACPPLPGATCDGTQGFRESPIPCGAEADFITCKTTGDLVKTCTQTITRRKQGCK